MRLAVLALALSCAAPAGAQTAERLAADQGAFVGALGALHAGDADTAARELEALLERRPDDAAVLDALAEAYTALGRPDDALYHAGLAAAATSRPEPRLRLARLQAERGELAAAAELYETATTQPTADPGPLVALADLYARLGRDDDERRTIERLLGYGETAAARLRLAVLAEEAGEFAEAARHLAMSLALEPADPESWRRLARAREAAGDPAGAAEAAAVAARLDPASTPSLDAGSGTLSDDADLSADDLLARLVAALNRAEEAPEARADALALADRALDAAPQRADVLAAAGEAAALAGQDALAADRLVAAVEADPRQLGAWELGLVVLARLRDERAAAHADEATLLFGSVPRIVAAAALAFDAAGRADDAERSARRALDRLNADDPYRSRLLPLVQ